MTTPTRDPRVGLLLLLLTGVSLACHPTEKPPLNNEPPATPSLENRAKKNSTYEGRASGMEIVERAQSMGKTIYKEVPTPAWSTFPGMKGERVRAPIRRVKPPESKPVLFVMLDTTRADRLSAYGHHRKTSPNVDRVADEGVRLTNFYANGAWTRPSVVSMMTSKYRSDHGVEVGQPTLPEEETTLAELFEGSGYATAAFVGNRSVTHKNGFAQGFEVFEDPYGSFEEHPTADVLADRAIKWLDQNENPNWFMWLFVIDPHDPYEPGEEHQLWKTDYMGPVKTPGAEYTQPRNPRAVDRMLALYDGEIHQMDAGVGKLFAHLKAKGIYDDVTIVIVADHGEAFGENLCFRHPYHFWEPNIHVPFILSSPMLADDVAGKVEDRPFQGIDLAPTLIDLVGLRPPKGYAPSGTSVVATMEGSIAAGWNRPVYTELDGYGLERTMVRVGPYKYLRFEPSRIEALQFFWPKSWESLTTANHTDVVERLYNLEVDPKETKNLVATNPEALKRLRATMDRFRSGDKAASRDQATDTIPKERLDELKSLGYME